MWTKDQNDAINVQGKNILVSASAGSGKTAVLVNRVIFKVIKYGIDIDKQLVVTFTNAAASELKERLFSAIYDKLSVNKGDLFLKRQLLLLNRANITTIHSFCLELIKSNFEELNMDPNFKIADEPRANVLKVKAMNAVLESKYKEEGDTSNLLYKVLELFSGKDENLVDELFKIYSYLQSFAFPFEFFKEKIDMYNISNEVDLSNTKFGKEILNSIIFEIKFIKEKAIYFREKIEGDEEFLNYVKVLDEDILTLDYLNNFASKSWDELYDFLNSLKLSNAPRYKGNNIELKDDIMSFRNSILKEYLKDTKRAIYERSNVILKENKEAYIYLMYLYNFLLLFDKEYKDRKKSQGVIDFNDIEHLALNLLVRKTDEGYEKTDIAKELQKEFIEIYTDEYQDTSFVQEAILNSIASDNNRFMVGDIKQSIYRFRQAMPDIFNKKYIDFEKLDIENEEMNNAKIILDKNFRSRKGVLDSINYIFKKIMSMEVGECNYTENETLKLGIEDRKELDGVNYLTDIEIINVKKEELDLEEDTNLDDIEELKKFEIEAIMIAKKIKELKKDFKIYEDKTKTFRNVEFKDIVILVRGIKDKGEILKNTCKRYNIPTFCYSSTNLFESEEIKLILSFLNVIDNPYQDVFMMSVMYSIIGNFKIDEIISIRSVNKRVSIYEDLFLKEKSLKIKENLEKDEKILLEKISLYILLLEKFKNYSKIYKVSELLTRIYKETSVYYLLAIEPISDTKKANLNFLTELAINYESDFNITLNSYIIYINSLIRSSDKNIAIAKVSGEDEDLVRIMTIHKSKGLEFPIVILANSNQKYNLKDASKTITYHHSLGIGINIVKEELGITYPSVIKQAIKNRLNKETKSEELRMLYVALTRAKEKLVVFATVNDYEKLIASQFVMKDKEKIDPSVVLKNTSYFQNIMMALKDYDKENNLFNINITNINGNQKSEKIEEIFKEDLEIDKKRISIKDMISSLEKPKDTKKVEEYIEILKSNINYKYIYETDTKSEERISVSELKKEDMSKNYYDFNTKEIEFKMPKVLDINSSYSSARKGTLVHFVLEHLDFKTINSKEDLKYFLDGLVLNKAITKEDMSKINIDKIYNLLFSKIGIEIKKSNIVKKEVQFILEDKKISASKIQGIIDIYYINENGKYVLVDFKTDKLTNEKEYIIRYKKQLDIYKEAIEKLENIDVEMSYIYSFELNREIEV